MDAVIDIPQPYLFLLEPSRYKVIYGGRNAGKDWNTIHCDLLLAMLYDPKYTEADIKAIAKDIGRGYGIKTGLIERSLRKPHRILYGREVMTSIKRSVYQTIKDRIFELGLSKKWVFRDDQIACINGSLFCFAGLYRDPHNLKSMEGITLARVVEAENVSEDSWKHLIPTIRAPGSEILISFNTRYQDDPTYQRWVVTPPKDAIVKKINSHDIEGFYKEEVDEKGNVRIDAEGKPILQVGEDGNPVEAYLTPEAKKNRENDFAHRRWEYDNVWLGEPLMAGRKIYPMFNEDRHVRHFDLLQLKSKANFFMAMDPAQKYHPACLWMAHFPDEYGEMIRYVYAEYPSYDDFSDYYSKLRTTLLYTGTIKDLATKFMHRGGEKEFGLEMKARFIDTRFATGSGGVAIWSNSTSGIVEEFLKHENGGLSFECPPVNVIDLQRMNIIKDMEVNILLDTSATNHSNLYIDPACVNLIQSMRNHRLEEKSEAEHPKYKDMSDTLRIMYAGMADPKYKWAEPGKSHSPITYTFGRREREGGSDSWMSN
jgi:PBSX family phage terminase large subunit